MDLYKREKKKTFFQNMQRFVVLSPSDWKFVGFKPKFSCSAKLKIEKW